MKYETEMAAHTDCPPPQCQAAQGAVCRFVKNPMLPSCFLPIGKENPRRARCCSDWGLSMYETESQAKTAHALGCAQWPNFKKKQYHLAVGTLVPTCGSRTSADQTGHFDLHEFAAADVHALFAISCPL